MHKPANKLWNWTWNNTNKQKVLHLINPSQIYFSPKKKTTNLKSQSNLFKTPKYLGCLVGKFKLTFKHFKQHYVHFFIHTYIKNIQTTLFKLLYQTPLISFMQKANYSISYSPLSLFACSKEEHTNPNTAILETTTPPKYLLLLLFCITNTKRPNIFFVSHNFFLTLSQLTLSLSLSLSLSL